MRFFFFIYLWSYNYQYPIAQIEGANCFTVKAALGYSNDQMKALAESTNPDVDSIDSTLREYFKGKPVMITTYTHAPLVGIKTMRTAQGVMTYNYDSFGRLINITDDDGNVLEDYQYHYKNQQ